MILISVKESTRRTKSCNAVCHNASKRPKCRCVCGGKFHGAAHKEGGLAAVIDQAGAEVEQALGLTPGSIKEAFTTNKPIRIDRTPPPEAPATQEAV